MKSNRSLLDLSSADIDGSHTPAIKGGEEVIYQGRKKRKTTIVIDLKNSVKLKSRDEFNEYLTIRNSLIQKRYGMNGFEVCLLL